ncbi:MAG: hypothetical protein FWD33_01630 [Alphaproteobacteria bacterium]|nr:hypothetical protein [Alphaproteobacteria bacterium]
MSDINDIDQPVMLYVPYKSEIIDHNPVVGTEEDRSLVIPCDEKSKFFPKLNNLMTIEELTGIIKKNPAMIHNLKRYFFLMIESFYIEVPPINRSLKDEAVCNRLVSLETLTVEIVKTLKIPGR